MIRLDWVQQCFAEEEPLDFTRALIHNVGLLNLEMMIRCYFLLGRLLVF